MVLVLNPLMRLLRKRASHYVSIRTIVQSKNTTVAGAVASDISALIPPYQSLQSLSIVSCQWIGIKVNLLYSFSINGLLDIYFDYYLSLGYTLTLGRYKWLSTPIKATVRTYHS